MIIIEQMPESIQLDLIEILDRGNDDSPFQSKQAQMNSETNEIITLKMLIQCQQYQFVCLIFVRFLN